MVNRRSFLAGSLAAVSRPFRSAGASGIEFYVAPAGRDVNPGTRDKPFATIERARDEVRKLIRSGLQQNVIIRIRHGTYKLQAPIVFGPQDSGTDQYSITYRARKQ